MNNHQKKIPNLKSQISSLQSPISILLLLLLSLFTRPVAAHGAGKMQVASAPAGPFLLTVWTGPDPARVGDLHVSVAVAFAEDNTPALEENVTVRLVPAGNASAAQEKMATTAASTNKFLYETDFALQSADLYQVTVEARNAAGAGGRITFDLLVEEKNSFNWSFFLLVTVALVSVASIIWYVRTTASLPHEP